MKTFSRFIPILSLICFVFFSCDDADKAFMEIKKASIYFGSSGVLKETIPFKTNVSSFDVQISEDGQSWCNAKVIGDVIEVAVLENTTLERRIAIVTVIVEGAKPQNITVSQQAREKSSEKSITSFFIPADINNLKSDIEGVVDQENRTISFSSTEWIPNVKELIVCFEAVGTVLVVGTEQVSGVTPNSFMDKMVYVAKAEDDSTIEYEVVATGPMFTGLPVISVDIEGGVEVKEKTKKLPATFCLTNPGDSVFDMSDAAVTIRGRGNSTWLMPKKPYRIDFPEKTSVFGLPKAKKWVLLANYQDPTLLMNDVTFELGRRFGLEYTHSSIHVDLFVNGKYMGNYQFTEQKEIGVGRVDIDKKNGFLVEMDSYYDEDYKFRTTHLNLPVMVAGPDLNSVSEMDYIKDAIQGLEDALFDVDFPNDNYEKYTDVNSLINFILINEFVRNTELGHPKSTYCYKDVDTKIMWGPLWDFDWAFGYNDGAKTYFSGKSLLFYPGNGYVNPGYKFFNRFMSVPSFRAKYKARWKEMKPQVVDIVNYIDEMSIKLDKSQTENFKVKSAIPKTKNMPYKDLIAQMKTWLEERIVFLDSELEKF